jgi:2-methylaconitate cis-trans-isomerase PrpF
VSRHDVPPSTPVQKPIKAAYYRGGTSRAVMIQPQHLPRERAKWPAIFRQIMGSGDPYGRQLDGMGAGISSLSKICLVEPYGKRIPANATATRFRTGYGGIDAARESAQQAQAQEEARQNVEDQQLDIDYTFVGLGIENDEVDVAGNCGNMSSAIGPYGYNAGLLPPRIYAQGDGEVTVRIRNTNTGKLINSTFTVLGAQAAVVGDYSIDGVTGNGSKIKLDFKNPYGSKTGKVLPTGKRIDNIAGYKVSCIDGANPAVFIRADDVGVDGTILPNDFNKLTDKLALLESIRKAAAVAMGIAATEDEVPRTIPKIGLVSQSSTHTVLSGKTLQSSQMDIVLRFLSDTQPHRAIPLTAALTTAVAARIPGTIVEQMLAPDPLMEGAITIGHGSGRLQVNAIMDEKNKLVPITGTVYRTAKRLFEGEIFWTDSTEETSEAGTIYGSNGRHSLGLGFVLENRGQSSSHLFEEDAQPKQEETIGQKQPEAEQDLIQVKDDEEEAKPSRLGYRPLPDPHRKIFPASFPDHPDTPLVSALQKLHSQTTRLLSDPDLTSHDYPTELVGIVRHAQLKLFFKTRTQQETKRKASESIKKKANKKVKKASKKKAL